MALTWDLTRADPAALAPGNWTTTHTLLMASMAVGLGALDAKNVREWRVRLALWAEPVNGACYAPLRDLPLKAWEMRFGLRTNVSPETRAHLRNRVAKFIENEAERRVRQIEKGEAS